VHGEYTTTSGKKVSLGIYSDKENVGKLSHALYSIKRSMQWDEDVFGLECDLDLYNIVATNDFNMGAMENKGLNIFNSAYVLADSKSATDADFEVRSPLSPPLTPPSCHTASSSTHSFFPRQRRVLAAHSGRDRARILSQLDRQPRDGARLVPADAQGGLDGLPRSVVHGRRYAM